MYNIFEAQVPNLDVNPTSDKLHRAHHRRKAQQCESRCTDSRWAAIEWSEAARHAEDDSACENAGVGHAPRAAAGLKSGLRMLTASAEHLTETRLA